MAALKFSNFDNSARSIFIQFDEFIPAQMKVGVDETKNREEVKVNQPIA